MKKHLLLFAAVLISGMISAQDCSELFFSEYVEGSGNNKVLEIYNPTDQAVDLSLYAIKRYSNGSPVPSEDLTLSGTLAPGGVVVVTNGQTDSVWVPSGTGYWSLPIDPVFYDLGDLHCSGDYPTPMYFNGNDAMTLEKITGEVVDIFGKTGDDPGSNGWNDVPPTYYAGDDWWTSWSKDQTLIRKRDVKQGASENPAIFMVDAEWDSLPKDTHDSLGFHTCDCIELGIIDHNTIHSIVIYPNPVTARELTIDADAPIIRVMMMNMLGQLVYEQQFDRPDRNYNLTVPSLETGVYTIRVFFRDETSSLHKVIVE